jgi:putative CocE/NonD family hydrolase
MADSVQRAGETVHVEFDAPARMRDGVTLRANVYRPNAPGPWPTLLTRTPYDKNNVQQHVWCGLDPVLTARQGFLVVIQDVRGRFASEGDWDPLRCEREDGYDSVEWAASLAGSNGHVGMFSASYCGNTQWSAAAERPPSLTAISPAFTWAEPLDGLFGRGGALELGLALRWAVEHGLDTVGRRERDEATRQERLNALIDEWDRLEGDGYWTLPVDDIAVLHRHGVPALGGLGPIDNADAVGWSRVTGAYEQVTVPTLHTGGWYDIFSQGTLDNYAAMAATGADARLVIGAWAHESFADPIGQLRFGQRAARDGGRVYDGGDWRDLQLGWFRQHLDPDAGVHLPPAPVRIFVMGRNEWRDEPGWPLERSVQQPWYLRSGGGLTTAAPAVAEPPSEFAYDPARPVPTVGGHGVPLRGYRAGPIDQAEIEGRDDVRVYTSEPLWEDVEVTGRVTVVLHAQSTAPSTDWVARLCDVHPDGRSFNLCDGILRIPSGADGRCRYQVDLWSTSNVFLRGHRIRVHVTSSSFPRWDRNLNTGEQNEPHHRVAQQRIFHDADHASYIQLPVIA